MDMAFRKIVDKYFHSLGYIRDAESNCYRLPFENRKIGERNILVITDELIEDDWEAVKIMMGVV